MARHRRRWPKFPSNARVVIRAGFSCQYLDERREAVPEMRLLADAEGFRYLSRVFEFMADCWVPPAGEWENDPENHQHLWSIWDELSDRWEIRLGKITDENFELVRRKYGLTLDTRKTGDLKEQFETLIREAQAAIAPE